MRTPMGWTCGTGLTEFNARSIANWPVQATSTDIMRLACIMTARARIGLCGCVHDALVIESSIERIDAEAAATQEIMRRASRIVLNSDPNGKYELRTDATIVRYPDRYTDKRGTEMWETVLKLLAEHQQQQQQQPAATREAG
jgi:DNA polymerase-1